MNKLKLFDSHFHIIDPKFSLIDNNSYLPPEFTVNDYLTRTQQLNIIGGALVSGSFQGFDQTYLLAALKLLGPTFVGVTQLPASVGDEEIIKLDAAGVKAVRFNLKRGGSEKLENLETFAKRVYDLVGWHIEIYVDSIYLKDLYSTLLKLPAVSIDHLGLSKEGLQTLLSLVEHGIKVKASGFGRVDFDVATALKDLTHANPDALMFGTDLPSTRAKRPFLDTDIGLISNALNDNLIDKVLRLNALNFYKVKL